MLLNVELKQKEWHVISKKALREIVYYRFRTV